VGKEEEKTEEGGVKWRTEGRRGRDLNWEVAVGSWAQL
jgi:hypothetical protein